MTLRMAVLVLATLSAPVLAQTANPIPLVNSPLVPDAIAPGHEGFALTVNGTGFVPASVVLWNGKARHTTFVRESQLVAQISSSDILHAQTATVTVINPSPAGGISNPEFFSIHAATDFISEDVR